MVEKNQKVKIAEYGSWSSPITAEIVVKEGGLPFSPISEVHTCVIGEQETVFWSELRPIEDGRIVVCSQSKGQSDIVSWTPEGFNARTKVHEYGGGATFVDKAKGHVYFSNFNDQRLYKQESPGSSPQPITPDGKGLRYADGEMVEFANKIICVREDHGDDDSAAEKEEARNTIVCIDPVTQEQCVLVKGADFYSSPRVSSTGMLAWSQWSHPNMPWDTTEIWLGQLDSSGEFLVEGSAKQIAYDEDVSVMLPRWTADDALFLISDRSDWWNLYEYIFDTDEERNVFPEETEIGRPHWIFGNCAYCPHPTIPNKIAVVYGGKLGILNSELEKRENVDTGFDLHAYPKFSPNGDKIYCIAGSTTRPYCLIEVDVESKKVVVIKDTKGDSDIDAGYISEPKTITFPTEDNKVAHGYLYLPKNKDYSAPPQTLPPLLVKAHGGPTSDTSPAFDLAKQFFTSRGVAILDVNYRGSTGFGMHYRKELYNNWGKVDVEDCCNGALYVANSMKAADVDKLCIDGGSAGGFTALACLTQRDVFKAGASKYGVSDVEALVRDTHKFESRYIDSMIGEYPECKDLYVERSPINSIEKLNCPMIFFQGDEDEVVPPSQSEKMFEAVKNKGLTCAYVLFKGEQHGFRKSETIEAVLEGEFCFFAKVFDFEPANITCKLDIQNLKN